MGNKKLTFICLAIFSLFLFSLISVSALESANITVVTPIASGTLSGASAVFNCSIVAGYEGQNYTTAKIYLQSAGLTANTTETLMATVSNTTAYDFNGTLASTTVQDGSDYTFKCSLFNGTSYVNATRTGIAIDNGVPTAPTLSPADLTTVTTAGTQTFTGTVVDAETTACTYTIYRGGSPSDGTSGSGSYSGTSCTFPKAFSTSADNGVWWWTVTATDGKNSTTTNAKLNVNLVGAGSGSLLPLDVAGDGTAGASSNAWKWVIGIIVVILIIVAIFFFGRKK